MKSILICGVGSIGKRHVDNFGKLFDTVDIVDTNPERVKETINKYKIRNHFNSIYEGKNRQIRRMIQKVGSRVLTLKRIRFGPILLTNLQPNEAQTIKPFSL